MDYYVINGEVYTSTEFLNEWEGAPVGSYFYGHTTDCVVKRAKPNDGSRWIAASEEEAKYVKTLILLQK